MKKKGILFIIVLILFVIIGYFIDQKPTTKKETAAVKIGVLQLVSHPALDEIYQGLVDQLSKEGYTEGKNLIIDLQNAQGDQSNLATMSAKLVENNNDIIVGITTPSVLMLANQTKTLPIIMSGVTYPKEAGIIKDEHKPGTNITGVSDRINIDDQFEVMKQVLPNLKKVGVIYTASELNATRQVEEAKKIAAEKGIELIVSSISNTNDIEQVMESLSTKSDAIYIPIDNMLASAMATVSKVSDKYNIPIFPSADTMVKDGGLLGIGVNQYNIGVETAKLVVKTLKGATPSDTPIVIANEGTIYLNEEKAKKLNITIPDVIKNKAKIVK